jgi:hypothetical protein
VLSLRGGRIVEITGFLDPDVHRHFGLPDEFGDRRRLLIKVMNKNSARRLIVSEWVTLDGVFDPDTKDQWFNSVVHTLLEHDMVDEYRLLVFPIVLGEGERVFRDGIASIDLELAAAEPVGAAVLLTYKRATPR